MIMDEKGKLFGKISIVDILIVLVVLAAIAGVGYKFAKSKVASPFVKPDTIQIQFYGEEIPDYAAKAVKKGDAGVDPVKNSVFGSVTDVKIDKSASYGTDAKGQYVRSSKDGYSSIYVTLEGSGTYSDNGVKFGSDLYFIGKTMEVRVGNTALWVRISDIRKKG